LTCGPQLRGHFKNNPENIVISQRYRHFDFIKIYSYVTRDEYHAILSTAKKLGFYTAGHIPFQVGLDGVLAEGMDEIAHIEEFLWEFSDFDRRRYFESEGERILYCWNKILWKMWPTPVRSGVSCLPEGGMTGKHWRDFLTRGPGSEREDRGRPNSNDTLRRTGRKES